jgi:segregation and condensation protein B
MSNEQALPELKQILGAMVFAANRPLSVKEMRSCLREVAASHGGAAAAFGEVKERDIETALGELRESMAAGRCGSVLTEVAGGFVIQTDVSCGLWLKHLLNVGKPSRLSRPALETLAIIAYRQPVTRADIELVRGVTVDHVIRALMEMQLVKIVGRSEMPGRPFLYGTTHVFLEHFGLRSLEELSEMEPMLFAAGMAAGARRPAATRAATAEQGAKAGQDAAPEPDGGEADEDDDEDDEEDEDDDEDEDEEGT